VNDARVIAGIVVGIAWCYWLVWSLWVRPRLLILREEALRTRYRVPAGLLAVYVVALAVAPLTGLVVAVGWGIAETRRLTHSWKRVRVAYIIKGKLDA
jgi:hypothetical protein